MDLITLLALITPIVIGYLIIQLLLPGYSGEHRGISYLWKLFLAPGFGYALLSCIYFVWSIIFTPERYIYGLLFLEFVIVVLLSSGVFFSRGRNNKDSLDGTPEKRLRIDLLTILGMVIFIVFGLNFVLAWLRASFQTPFGDWDAWAIWNLRAGFIASGSDWLQGFSPEIAWSHPDYPLLLPLNVARLWVVLGDRSIWMPILLGFIFQSSMVGLLTTSVMICRGYLQGLIAGILGLVILFVSLNFKLYADIPMAYYLLAANILIFFADLRSQKSSGYLVLAGVMVAASLWTKNEGWVFLVVVVLSKMLLDLVSRNKSSQSARWWKYFIIGLLPILTITVFFKLAYAPPGDILSSLDFNTSISNLFSISRYITILKYSGGQFIYYGNLIFPLMPLLLVYAIIMGISFPRLQKHGVLFLTFSVFILAIIYFFIYVLTPKDLSWHLGTSLERLITHIMPSFLFLYFLVISTIKGKEEVSESMLTFDWSNLGIKSN